MESTIALIWLNYMSKLIVNTISITFFGEFDIQKIQGK